MIYIDPQTIHPKWLTGHTTVRLFSKLGFVADWPLFGRFTRCEDSDHLPDEVSSAQHFRQAFANSTLEANARGTQLKSLPILEGDACPAFSQVVMHNHANQQKYV